MPNALDLGDLQLANPLPRLTPLTLSLETQNLHFHTFQRIYVFHSFYIV
jgi:hypothetical protein